MGEDVRGVEAALKYDGDEYGGRTLKVSIADGKGKAHGKGAAGKGKSPSSRRPKPPGCTSVVVKGIAYAATEEDLLGVFASCGGGAGPSRVKLLRDRTSGESKGIAFLDFQDTEAVDQAMLLSETELKGRCFFMDYAPGQK